MSAAAAVAEFWVSKRMAAGAVSMSLRQFHDVILPRLSEVNIRGTATKRRSYFIPAVVNAHLEYRLSQAKPQPEDVDPLMTASGSSLALERYRAASAALKECDLEERAGKLVDMDVVGDTIRPLASIFRSGVDRARREFGNTVGDFFNEVAVEFDSAAMDILQRFDERKQNAGIAGKVIP